MDRFLLKRPNGSCSSPSPAKKKKLSASSRQGPNVTADIRVAEFGKHLFYVDSGHLFCWACNMVVDHVRKLPFSFDFASKLLDFHREVTAISTILTAKLPRFLRF
ncbi:MAG: hypothetical protein GY820_09725 [Gammaproteobacteria bacterium]|nr:hypothetical protein [Gammaproteobacteria bacterium]